MNAIAERIKSRLGVDSPAFWGAVVGGLVGLGLITFGVSLFFRAPPAPLPLNIALIILGSISVAVSTLLLRRNRAAWAFAVSLNGTAALATVIAAPRIRDTFGLSIAQALIPAFVFAVIVLLHSLAADDF